MMTLHTLIDDACLFTGPDPCADLDEISREEYSYALSPRLGQMHFKTHVIPRLWLLVTPFLFSYKSQPLKTIG